LHVSPVSRQWKLRSDRRRSILTLSDQGRQLYEQIAPLAMNLESELLEGLTEQETTLLQKIIETLYSKSEEFGKAYLPSPSREISGLGPRIRKSSNRPAFRGLAKAAQPAPDKPSIRAR
jgi:hypothetical protein